MEHDDDDIYKYLASDSSVLRVAFRCFYMHMTIILGRASLVPMHRVAAKYLHDFLFRSV